MITIVQVNCIVPSHMTLISRRHNVDVFVLVLHFRNSMRWLWFKLIKIWLQRRYFRLETLQMCRDMSCQDFRQWSMAPNNGNEKVQYKLYSIVCLWVEFLDHESGIFRNSLIHEQTMVDSLITFLWHFVFAFQIDQIYIGLTNLKYLVS